MTLLGPCRAEKARKVAAQAMIPALWFGPVARSGSPAPLYQNNATTPAKHCACLHRLRLECSEVYKSVASNLEEL